VRKAETVNPPFQGEYDVVVIGAGIVGSMIARELSRFAGRFALVEREGFSGFGVSKANPCMLHSPLMFPSGPLRIKLAYNALARYKKLADELDVAFNEVDEIFLAFDASQLAKLETLKKTMSRQGTRSSVRRKSGRWSPM
jgi:glycerol-3-phosphate dehydrogenase